MVPGLVDSEWTFEPAVIRSAANDGAVLVCLWLLQPAIPEILALSPVDLQLVGLYCDLVLIRVRVLFWIEELGQLL